MSRIAWSRWVSAKLSVVLSAARALSGVPSTLWIIPAATLCWSVITRNAVSAGAAFVGPVGPTPLACARSSAGGGGGVVLMMYLAPRHAAAIWRRTIFSLASAGCPSSSWLIALLSARLARATRVLTSDG